MILAAALLVLIALGLFVAGLLTGVTFWYWACVGVSALAAVLLLVARRQLARSDQEAARPRTREAAAPPAPREEQDDTGPGPEPERAEPEAATGAPATAAAAVDESDDPPAEDTEVSDLLLVVEMHDDVFVVDEHPRYHLADCRWLGDREAIPMPVDEARTDGFTPCGICSPDRQLAQVARARKSAETP